MYKIIKPKPKFKSFNTIVMLKNCQACQKAKATILPFLIVGVKRVQKLAQKVAKKTKTQQNVAKQHTKKEIKK